MMERQQRMGSQHRESNGTAPGADGSRSPRGPFRRWLANRAWPLRLAVMGPLYIAVTGVIMLSTALIYYTLRFPDPTALRQREQTPVVKVLARDGTLMAQRGRSEEKVPIDALPAHVVHAVLAIEDRRFYSHWGVDPWGIGRAVLANLRSGRYQQGGSTLTQQLAKNLFLSSDRRLGRKLEEVVLALWLELRLGKQAILELYLNRVYFGGGAYGIEAAAQRYFAKSARALTLTEAAIIAGLLKAPSRFSPASSPEAATERARLVLDAMRAAGFITPVAHAAALAGSVNFASARSNGADTGLEFAVESVLERLPQLAGQGHGEIIVETTIDAGLQRHAQSTVARMLAREKGLPANTQAGLVLFDTGGGIRAVVGGRGWSQSQFNRAMRARRQPGSAFKPLVYLAAVELGAAPDSIITDQPVTIAGWTPRNDQGFHRGPTTLRQALAHSINSVAVQLVQDVGVARVATLAHRLGIESELRLDPSLALGTSEVTLIELTRAYGVIAKGGQDISPHLIRRVYTSKGHILHARAPIPATQLVTRPHAAAVTDMLNAAIVSGTGRRAALPRHPAAGKTGTTQDFRDAWFVGFTHHMVAGVWIGNDGGEPMDKIAGGGLPAQIWREVMLAAHRGLPPLPLVGQEPATALAARTPIAPRAPEPADPIGVLVARSADPGSNVPLPDRSGNARPVATPLSRPRGIDPSLFAQALDHPYPEHRPPDQSGLDLTALERLLGDRP